MKKVVFSLVVVMIAALRIQAQSNDTIKDSGFAFSPAELTVEAGDTVVFIGTDFHPVVEVSEATWNDKGVTPLQGGFAFPSGSGEIKFTEPGVHYYVCTAHVASHNMKGKITVVSATSIPDISRDALASFYPNPLTGSTLFITFKNHMQKNLAVSIFDVAGNLILSSNGSTTNGQYSVDCSNLPGGLFLVKLGSDDGYIYTKIVKQ
jgi:plastocyanin